MDPPQPASFRSPKNIRAFQIKIVSEMSKLCHPRLNFPLSQSAASEVISKKSYSDSIYAVDRISARHVRRIFNHYLDFGYLPCDHESKVYRKNNNKFNNKNLKWTKEIIASLKAIVDECPVLFLDEMSDKLFKATKIKFSTSSISNCLRLQLKYSRKIVYEKATQQLKRDKDNFISTTRLLIKKPEQALWVDESNKDRKAARRKYGWSPIGQPVNYKALFNMDTRYTFIGAADFKGFVVPACEIVLHKYKDKEEHKPVNSERFVQYVREKLVPCLGNYERQEAHSVVIMDNCSIHMDIRVRELIEAAGAIIIYSAPYCPELIPIEYMFAQWKTFLKRNYLAFNNNWYEVHQLAIMSITPQQGINYFKNSTLTELIDRHPLNEEYKVKTTRLCVALAFLDYLI